MITQEINVEEEAEALDDILGKCEECTTLQKRTIINSGIHFGFTIIVLAAVLGLQIHEMAKSTPKLDPPDIVQMKMNTAVQESITAQQKRQFDIQSQIAKTCLERGGIPAYFNNNVDCKRWDGKQ